jgi:5,10-methylenetetrahydromethanopterin reductase
VTSRDRKLVDQAGPMIAMMGWVGSADQIREKAEAAIAAGATEILYTPAGPDVPRELRAWATALR